jgi:hypothetical protein
MTQANAAEQIEAYSKSLLAPVIKERLSPELRTFYESAFSSGKGLVGYIAQTVAATKGSKAKQSIAEDLLNSAGIIAARGQGIADQAGLDIVRSMATAYPELAPLMKSGGGGGMAKPTGPDAGLLKVEKELKGEYSKIISELAGTFKDGDSKATHLNKMADLIGRTGVEGGEQLGMTVALVASTGALTSFKTAVSGITDLIFDKFPNLRKGS